MAAGASAKNLYGECLVKPLTMDGTVRNCIPWREFCIHTLISSPAQAGGGSTPIYDGTYFCGQFLPQSAQGTKVLTISNLLNTSSRPYGIRYGKTSDTVGLSTLDGSPVYFSSNDLQAWRLRPVATQVFWYAQGPPVNSGHLVKEVRRRLKGSGAKKNGNYANRYDFYFTDSDEAHDGNGNDWMGPIHPANFFWTNKGVDEPFAAVTHYEQSGTNVSQVNYSQGYIPFCDPMPVRDENGNQIGNYVGYTCLHYASPSFIHSPVVQQDPCLPDKLYLPNDYYQTTPNVDGSYNKVVPTNQFIQVETHWFIAATSTDPNNPIGSPKIGSTRHWFYNKPSNSFGDPCNEYIYVTLGGFQNEWKFNVNFNVLSYVSNAWVPAPDELILFNLSGLQIYLTP